MSDLKVGDRVQLPTDPAAYDFVVLDQNYGLEGDEKIDYVAKAVPEYTSEKKAELLGGRVGTLEDLIMDGRAEFTTAIVNVEDEKGPAIALGVPVGTLTLAPA